MKVLVIAESERKARWAVDSLPPGQEGFPAVVGSNLCGFRFDEVVLVDGWWRDMQGTTAAERDTWWKEQVSARCRDIKARVRFVNRFGLKFPPSQDGL